MDGDYLSTGQAARLCAVTPDTVLKWIKRGRLRARRTPGGHYRISHRDLQILRKAFETGAADSARDEKSSERELAAETGRKNLVVFSPGGAEGVALCGAEFLPHVHIEIVESGYELSTLVERFRPDYAIIDATVGMERARELSRNLLEDPRLRVSRVLLATEPGRVPEEGDRGLFAHIEIPITREKFEECLRHTD